MTNHTYLKGNDCSDELKKNGKKCASSSYNVTARWLAYADSWIVTFVVRNLGRIECAGVDFFFKFCKRDLKRMGNI